MAGSVLFDAPGQRARARNRVFNGVTAVVIALVIWVVYSKLNSKGQLTAAKWEPFLTANLWKTYILPGVQGTLIAAAVSIVLALALGFLLGVGRLSAPPAISWPCSVVVSFSSTPRSAVRSPSSRWCAKALRSARRTATTSPR